MNRKDWIFLHRWSAGIGGALLIALSITGLWYPLQVYFPALRGRVEEVGTDAPLDRQQVLLSASEAADRALASYDSEPELRSVQLLMMGPYAVYDIRTGGGRRILRAQDGEPFQLSQAEAEAVARERYGLGDRPLEGVLQDSRSLRYWGEVGLPAYVFNEVGRSSPVYAVSRAEARTFAGTRMQKISAGLMRAHQFWPIEEVLNRTVQRAVLVFSGVLSLMLGITGYFLLFPLRWRRKRRAPVELPLLLFLMVPAVVEAQERTLTVADLFGVEAVGNPVLSPEGSLVAFTRTVTSLEDEDSETRVWVVSRSGGGARAMTATGGSASSPAWSPDGHLLTFLASRGEDARSQVWAMDRRGGEAWALTDLEQGVSSYSWSPDGTRLALLLRDPEPEDEWTDSKTRRPWVIDRVQFKRDGAGYLDRRRTHLHVLTLASSTLTRLTEGDFDHSSPVWSPDGTRIAFVSNRTDEPDSNDNTDVWVVPADASGPVPPHRVTTNPGADGQPAWSPDGRWIAHTTVVEPEKIWYATQHLAVVPAEGGEARLLTRELDRNVGSPRFTADGTAILFEVEDSGERHIARLDVTSGRMTRPVAGYRSVRGFDVDRAGRMVVRAATPERPAELFAVEGSELRTLTAANDWMEHVRLGEVRNVHFSNPDGMEIEAFLTLPVGYQDGERVPLLLRNHGGPVSQYDASFNFEAQLFAAGGYAVLQVNPRGSSGYGQAFSHALWANWGVPDFADVMAGVDWAIREGIADPERLGVGGWSYGGILTNYVITKSTRFKAAISGASEVNYAANYGHDHYQRQWEAELGLPWEPESRETWERITPFNNVGNVVTPTLVMGGERDWNVPIQNSEQLYQALRRRGISTQLVVYPGQGHGIRTPSYQKDRLERYLAWYDKWLKGGAVS